MTNDWLHSDVLMCPSMSRRLKFKSVVSTAAVGALSVSLSTLFDKHQIHYRISEDALPTENNLSLKSFGMQ